MTDNIGHITILVDNMDIRARIIDKYTIYVVDIDNAKELELFQFNQQAASLPDSSEAYKSLEAGYDARIKDLENMLPFSESNPPTTDIFEAATPYYEESSNTIQQKWEVRQEQYLIKSRIEDLKKELSNSDYKIIKCYEANLLGEVLPYDINALHAERQAIRGKINELEEMAG